MNQDLLLRVLMYGALLIKLLFLGKLCRLGLAGRYRVLSIYLTFSVCRSITNIYLLRSGARLFGLNGYALFYVMAEPVSWLLYFLLVLELYSLMLAEFSGVRRLGRLVMFSGLAGVALACSALMIVDRQGGAFSYPFLASLALEQRSVFISLSVLAIMMVLFASHFRLPLSRNLVVVGACFGAYFTAKALMTVLFHYLGADFRSVHNVLSSSFYFIAVLSMATFVSPAGENVVRRIVVPWAKQDEEVELALLSQLRGFNQVLASVLKQ